jgi:hypothetical protein
VAEPVLNGSAEFTVGSRNTEGGKVRIEGEQKNKKKELYAFAHRHAHS